MTQIETIETISCFDELAGWGLMSIFEPFGLMGPSFSECEYFVTEALEAEIVGRKSCRTVIHSKWI